jgi:DNA modification methylase
MKQPNTVTCLGRTFSTEEERREYYRNELRNKLPELKHIDGFPIGEDEDIIALSDPPYYTACPNPWLNDFIAEWEKEKDIIPGRKKDFEVDEPYASDVSEGKNNPIYNAHSYHTKVPHPAIMRYILHYTQPGDIVLDGFAGTGMTGVAAQMCSNPDNETRYRIDKEFRDNGLKSPAWGVRKAINSDLSPIATFISYNYNLPVDVEEFQLAGQEIIKKAKENLGWMFETTDANGKTGEINFTIWSDVFICPNCGEEIVFWDVAVDHSKCVIRDEFNCSKCNSKQTKRDLERAKVTTFDSSLNEVIVQAKSVPVIINYSINNKRFEKVPAASDISLMDKIENFKGTDWYPILRMPIGDESRRNDDSGITHVHQFHVKNNLLGLAYVWEAASNDRLGNAIKLSASAANPNFSKMRRFRPDKKGGGPLAGTLYISSLTTPQNCFLSINRNINFAASAFQLTEKFCQSDSLISTNSCTSFTVSNNSIDYIFTDPPFGANIMYSELNFVWEAWLKVITNNTDEAIEDKAHGKSFVEYQNLMTNSFKEYFRVLKHGKWMTVEFSNTSAAVWNGIQTSLQRAGFIIANVAALDKKQGSFKAVTNTTSVKQDLVISCYKPSFEFENKFKKEHAEVAIWDFVVEHLHHLPVHMKKDNSTTAIIERSPKILFDRLITFYLMRSLQVPIDSQDFQAGLKEKFSERDGMYFTAEQVAEYDEQKAQTPKIVQQELFVGGENDAIEWLKERLRKTPQKYQDIMPDFRKAPQSIRKGDSIPELNIILEQNFIQDAEGKWRTPNPNEAKDRDALRNKALIKEFNAYLAFISQAKAKKLKEVRVEALRAGFKNCWEEKAFKTIVTLGDMIPQNILLEDDQLLMYYDIAKDKI